MHYLLKIVSTYLKKDVYYWGAGILQSKIVFTQNAGKVKFDLITMGDYFNYISNFVNNTILSQDKLPFVIFGPMRFRFVYIK